jgi:hypothetical protein
MTPDTTLQAQTHLPAETPPLDRETESTPPELIPLPHALRQIARDSRTHPEQYLDETRVRAGGE